MTQVLLRPINYRVIKHFVNSSRRGLQPKIEWYIFSISSISSIWIYLIFSLLIVGPISPFSWKSWNHWPHLHNHFPVDAQEEVASRWTPLQASPQLKQRGSGMRFHVPRGGGGWAIFLRFPKQGSSQSWNHETSMSLQPVFCTLMKCDGQNNIDAKASTHPYSNCLLR